MTSVDARLDRLRGSAPFGSGNLFRQPRKIRRQNRWQQLNHEASLARLATSPVYQPGELFNLDLWPRIGSRSALSSRRSKMRPRARMAGVPLRERMRSKSRTSENNEGSWRVNSAIACIAQVFTIELLSSR